MPPRRVLLLVEDIRKAVERAQNRLIGMTVESFLSDEKTIESVLFNFAVIGEAASKIPKAIREKNDHIPWQKMIGMRNVVIHEYFRIDFEILWNTIHQDLPTVIPLLEELAARIGVQSAHKKNSATKAKAPAPHKKRKSSRSRN